MFEAAHAAAFFHPGSLS